MGINRLGKGNKCITMAHEPLYVLVETYQLISQPSSGALEDALVRHMLFIPSTLSNQVAAAWVHLALPYARESKSKLSSSCSVNESDKSDAGSSEFED